VNLYTIDFTKTSAEGFFSRLVASSPARVVDVRLNNVSQLAGFAHPVPSAFQRSRVLDQWHFAKPWIDVAHSLSANVSDVSAETFEALETPSRIRRARAACWQSTQTPSS
jgi:hypothetical protein